MLKCFFLFLSGLCLVTSSLAQSGEPSEKTILEKLSLYAKANPDNLLFVHTDKTIYTNNETIWFSGYLVRAEGAQVSDHTILSVALMRDDNRKVMLQNKYVMQNGLGFGSLTLPDSIPPGNYQFIASTNVLDNKGELIAIFTQPITLKSITEQDFSAELSLLDTVITDGVVRAKVTVNLKQPDDLEKIAINYSIGKGAEQSVVLKRDQRDYVITIPREQLNTVKPSLLTAVKYHNNVQYLSIGLPEVQPKGIHVRFFPEGGHLVQGVESSVAWEAKTTQDLPLSITGILYRNEKPVDTVSTTSYGAGSFKLTPDQESRYTFRITANPYLSRDTVYQLPKALTSGIVLHLKEAIVNDTLQISLSAKEPRTVRILIHNYRKPYAFFAAIVPPTGKKLSVALGPLIPKGIATITVLDDQDRPLAERLFFAHYDQGITASVQTDKQLYKRKEKVSVKLKLADKTGSPLQGIVSIAGVQDNRLESNKMQDVESYVYLKHEMGDLPQNPQGRNITNEEYLEKMLLIKGWRKYTWQDLKNNSNSDRAFETRTLNMRGTVRYGKKPLKKPLDVVSLRDSLIGLIATTYDGSFNLDRDNSSIREGRHIFLSVNKKMKEGYIIEIDDPFIPINENYALSVEIKNPGTALRAQSTADQKLKSMQRVIALKTVVISGDEKDPSLYGRRGAGSNICGDYVCRFNILNCDNHYNAPDNRIPFPGEMYYTGRLGLKPYAGCSMGEAKTIFKVNGIYTTREFYGVNTDAAGMLELQFLSTLFWKPGVVPDKNGETVFSFFTGDITGKFRIVVQGIGENDVIYGESSFVVK